MSPVPTPGGHGTASGHRRAEAPGELGGLHSPRQRQGDDPGLDSHNNQFLSAQTDLTLYQCQEPERLV